MVWEKCMRCEGAGSEDGVDCFHCEGSGYVPESMNFPLKEKSQREEIPNGQEEEAKKEVLKLQNFR